MNSLSDVKDYIFYLEESNQIRSSVIESYQKTEELLKNQIELYKEALEEKNKFIKVLKSTLEVYRSFFR
jgi:predicted RNase H-like HicB family nuclease